MLDTRLRVLLVYPGLFMQTALPLSIACLAAALISAGFDVKVFDTVLYQEVGEIDENEERAEHHHSTKHLDYASVGLEKKDDLLRDFEQTVLEYQPDLIGVSAVESTFGRGMRLAARAKNVLAAPIVVGGVFPTLAPEIAIADPSVDMVCIGEGEDALVELCTSLRDGVDHRTIKNLWVKENGNIIKNPLRPLCSLDDLHEPDFSVFQTHMFYKPMQGNLFKTIPIELSRGCPYNCSYCAEPSLKRLYRSHNQAYFRTKSIPHLFAEIERAVMLYAPEFFYFATETFLAMSEEDFDEFIEKYRRIKIPFWIQTRPETVTLKRITALQDVGMYWITMGIECGNEEFRRVHLKRAMTNERIKESVMILEQCGQGASLNSIIGFPHETRELMFETIMLNRELFRINSRIRANISVFTPFRGCELYDESIASGLFSQVPYLDQTNISSSALRLDALTDEEFAGICRTVPLYVYLPDEDIDSIGIAETFNELGTKTYEALNRKLTTLLG